jgi:PTH1 family peptidyl-tRNA hydrolase
MSTLRMIAGLGNPDAKYERTLHNAGFWFVDELAPLSTATISGSSSRRAT